ncbi:conserved hypothetical protein [Bacillus sp. 349Y]|nr:conserved hypothetical protein [Bacillus sp. 349Y]
MNSVRDIEQYHLGNEEKLLRQILEAESMILGAVLLEPGVIGDITLEEKHFSQWHNRRIFAAMRAVEDKGLDVNPVTLVDELREDVEQVGGVQFLLELAAHCPTAANVAHFESLVLKQYELALIRDSAYEFLRDYTPESAHDLYKALASMKTHMVHQEASKKELMVELYESLYHEREGLPGVATGFDSLDALTGGWKEGELIILAARPSMGKTAFAIQLAWECIKQDGVALTFSLEMSSRQVMQRLLSSLTGINMMKWNNPYKYLTVDEMPRMHAALNDVYKSDFELSQNGMISLQEMRQQILTLKQEHPDKPFLVLIDYLQLITVKGRFDRHDLAIGYITKELKGMAREFGIPIILLSQLSRGVESREDKRPRLTDLRDSGNIEQDADVVLFLYRDDYYHSDTKSGREVEIKIAKNRNGPVGTVKVEFVKEYGRFVGKNDGVLKRP